MLTWRKGRSAKLWRSCDSVRGAMMQSAQPYDVQPGVRSMRGVMRFGRGLAAYPARLPFDSAVAKRNLDCILRCTPVGRYELVPQIETGLVALIVSAQMGAMAGLADCRETGIELNGWRCAAALVAGLHRPMGRSMGCRAVSGLLRSPSALWDYSTPCVAKASHNPLVAGSNPAGPT